MELNINTILQDLNSLNSKLINLDEIKITQEEKLKAVNQIIKDLTSLNAQINDPKTKDLFNKKITEDKLESLASTQQKAKTSLDKALTLLTTIKDVKEPPPAQPKVVAPAPLSKTVEHTRVITSGVEIRVMDQKKQKGIGLEACGYHAFKNALIGIGLALNPQIGKNAFEDEIVYGKFYDFLALYKQKDGTGEKDLDIATLSKALEDFVKKKPQETPQELRPIQKALVQYPHAISMFNFLQQGTWGPETVDRMTGKKSKKYIPDKNSVTQLSTLEATHLSYLNDFIDFMNKPGPRTHAFILGGILGGSGHWTTILVEKDASQQLKFLGCDSWPGGGGFGSEEILNHNIDMLKRTFNNLDAFIKTSYYDAIGFNLERIAEALNPDGTIKQEQKFQNRLSGFDFNNKDRIDFILKGYELIQKAQWEGKTNDPQIKKYLKELKQVVNFLLPKVDANNNKLISPIAQALGKLNLN